ncbi:HNH endonuclease [Polymorphospora sp. NPDC050346]|uniref:HNH endonuclease n=1 Tax=Polymorphospora sp. NPDC050346 TaxID=3155780 RepID=UPI0033E6AAD0
MLIANSVGLPLNAKFSVEPDGDDLAIILHSGGGRTRSGSSRNADYRAALTLLLVRLREHDAVLQEALIDSTAVAHLPEPQRSLLVSPIKLADESDMEDVRRRLTAAQGSLGQRPGAIKAGNNSKRLRLRVSVPGFTPSDAAQLAHALSKDTSNDRNQDILLPTNNEATDLQSDPQLMLQPRGIKAKGGERHYQKSVRIGIQLADLAVDLRHDGNILRQIYPSGLARLWGSTPAAAGVENYKSKALRDRRVGDDILFYNNKGFFARARIVHLFRNQEAARAIWGADEDNQTWEYMVALDDLEEFQQPIPAEPLLQALNLPAPPLRSLTLVRSYEYDRIKRLLPNKQEPINPSHGPNRHPTRPGLNERELLSVLETLAPREPHKTPRSHLALTLLWSIAHEAKHGSRLVRWHKFRSELAPILARYTSVDPDPTVAHPFWHLGSSVIWEIDGIDITATTTSPPTRLDVVNPSAGLTIDASRLLKKSEVRTRAVRTLLTHHLTETNHADLLKELGMSGYESATGTFDDGPDSGIFTGSLGGTSRCEVTLQRIIRSTKVAETVKAIYDHHCQICGERLETPNGGYSQAAHTRGLGAPHHGPDHISNVLCLCPNHHVLFDSFAIYVDEHWIVRRAADNLELGALRRHATHPIDPAQLAYHRQLCGLLA